MPFPTNKPMSERNWHEDRLHDAEIEAITNVDPVEFLELVELRRQLWTTLGIRRANLPVAA